VTTHYTPHRPFRRLLSRFQGEPALIYNRDECDVSCIVSMPAGVFSAAGAGVKTNLLFFTKGTPTDRIWYYDLSDVKVGKKAPFTVDRFEEVFRLLPERTDSERSWTVSLAERRRVAADEAEPLVRQAQATEQELARWKDRVAELRKAEPRDEAAVAETEERLATLGREARDLRARGQAIAEAVYDLKAVNSHAKRDVDTRTPEELLDLIEAKGREVAEAIAALRAIGRS
jgi:type I restriction enzyme M protein